ncbi:DNA polymerase IV [Acidihalobacter yilgarnensis]|uniref:DNA polymerase IV n=2 Tax=Acidihalobacter yilgarnensis TaxID=2819280 RepID=A0A1D8IRS1_9GAMM|nr:DNA polymerase IV [Acidihalobacter yilgarnensis]
MSRRIMHIDLDAFFAAVEQRDHPEWRGRPLVVGAAPGQRGVVATCSYEARRYGVHSAMPISEAARRLPADTVYVRPRMAHYAAVSQCIMAALNTISPVVEPVSIDEAYLDVSGLERLVGPPEMIGQRAKQVIADAVGLTASVGIGPNRLIAKLASEYHKPDGLMVVPSARVQAFLDPMPLTALRGLGGKAAAVLHDLGLRTVKDVRLADATQLIQHLGAHAARRFQDQACGIASDVLHTDTVRKSISKETTFAEDITDPVLLRDTLLWAAQEIGHTARQAGLKGSTVTLKLRFRGFKTHTRQRTLPVPTADDDVLYRHAWALYQEGDWAARPVRLIGLGLAGWDATAPTQSDLFAEVEPAPATGREPLYATLDRISDRFGRGAVHWGVRRKP